MARFLVEQYLACQDPDALSAASQRHRDVAAASPFLVERVQSIYLPEDETCLTVFEAPRRQDLLAALAAADLNILRIGTVIELDVETRTTHRAVSVTP